MYVQPHLDVRESQFALREQAGMFVTTRQGLASLSAEEDGAGAQGARDAAETGRYEATHSGPAKPTD